MMIFDVLYRNWPGFRNQANATTDNRASPTVSIRQSDKPSANVIEMVKERLGTQITMRQPDNQTRQVLVLPQVCAMQSSLFRDGPAPDANPTEMPTLDVDDLDVWQIFLASLHGEDVDMTENNVLQLYDVATRYNCRSVRNDTLEHLPRFIRPSNLAALWNSIERLTEPEPVRLKFVDAVLRMSPLKVEIPETLGLRLKAASVTVLGRSLVTTLQNSERVIEFKLAWHQPESNQSPMKFSIGGVDAQLESSIDRKDVCVSLRLQSVPEALPEQEVIFNRQSGSFPSAEEKRQRRWRNAVQLTGFVNGKELTLMTQYVYRAPHSPKLEASVAWPIGSVPLKQDILREPYLFTHDGSVELEMHGTLTFGDRIEPLRVTQTDDDVARHTHFHSHMNFSKAS